MFESRPICPYTGLRSFTEEESLYFKGREDDIDQASNQLQRNKFLMLTGASGDGKSSLIYAGIIPNARAGFIKAKYSSWCVADFRPERTPFQNLCRSVARELEIANSYTVQSELNHGFSALVDLYKNSKRFIDTGSETWQNADEKSRIAMKHQAANLIILVDQFEEFFTNPENYQHGAPSKDANVVVNILLETARIALEEDLPIYIIFTMRSDYTGQCAAFRGLPEYIGFSQFFVPHLNRSQLQQVIEEPAILSGNRITRRLTERLIHDLTEGVDQLPILQHALNQVWVAASEGEEEMDLVHYAMVGGMSREELPAGHAERFSDWFNKLAPEIKACYKVPSLQNVLDTHTNKLYINAAWYYFEETGRNISAADARLIIKTAFTCLTKIDQGRAVRNRMTLTEITHILGMPQFDSHTVGAVLNSFREPGNTFIRPFINPEHEETLELQPGQVLDITHESLIRNWQLLEQWAKEEFDSCSIYIDFERQLERWVNSEKSGSFLLPIGPLTFFESWYNKAKPNEWWIARYLPEETGEETKLQKADETIADAKEFLAKSARKHVITRTMMRYGTKKIAIAAGVLLFITLSSFVVKSYLDKQNRHVLNSIHRETLDLANNSKVTLYNSAPLICQQLEDGTLTIEEVANSIPDSIRKVNVINGIGAMLLFQGHNHPAPEIHRVLQVSDSLLESMTLPMGNPILLSKTLNEANDHRSNLELAYYYSADSGIAHLRKRNAERSGKWVMKILEGQPTGFIDITNLTIALENAVNYHSFRMDTLQKLIGLLSPIENGLQSQWLKEAFDRDKFMVRGFIGYGFKFNGLYQELAYLYAAMGNSSKAVQCIDTLLRYSENNFQGDYSNGQDNAGNIALVFYANGKQDQLDEFVTGYCERTKTTKHDFYERLIGRDMPTLPFSNGIDLFWFMGIKQNSNVLSMDRNDRHFFFNKYREAVQASIKDPNERNFLMAVSLKNEGILYAVVRGTDTVEKAPIDKLFSEAVSYYKKLSPSFLNSPLSIVGITGSDELIVPKKYLFVYPDMRTRFHAAEPRSFIYFYLTDQFLEYIIDQGLFESFYPGQAELGYIKDWFTDFETKQFSPNAFFGEPIRYEVMRKLVAKLAKREESAVIDFNLLYFYLGQYAQLAGDSSSMVQYYEKIPRTRILNLLRVKEYDGLINDHSFRLIAKAIKGLAKVGRFEDARSFITVFKNPVNRSSLNAYVAADLIRDHQEGPLADRFLDSALVEMGRVEDTRRAQPNRQSVAIALMMKDPSANASRAKQVIRNIPEKFDAIQNIAKAYAFHGLLFQAHESAPPFISDTDMASFLWRIMLGYSNVKGSIPEEWKSFENNTTLIITDYIKYLDESN